MPRKTITQLESLPNEVLLNLFKLLNTVHLVLAFFGLNIRLNKLINLHLQVSPFNFQSISKNNFDNICQENLRLAVDSIILLRLSNEETPSLSELILSRGYTLDRFIHLKSLSLHYIESLGTLTKITSQCRYLFHLTHLEIINSECGETQPRISNLLNNIWNIPNLTHCNLNGIEKRLTFPSQISSISPCIKYLSMKNINCNLQFLSTLVKCTPNLEYLCTTITCRSTMEYLEYVMPSMITFEVSLTNILNSTIFEKMPNLNNLTIELQNMYLDGHEWEEIIVAYLPKIKVFRLKMTFEYFSDATKEEQTDDILNTFRSTFWLEEHRWFVRCRWNPSDDTRLRILYTLPYAFNSFHYFNEYCSKSTCSSEGDDQLYNQVRSIYQHEISNIDLSESLIIFDSYFSNIQHASLIISDGNNFLRSCPSVDRLTSLEVFLSEDSHYDQIQTLLDQTHHLYSLKVTSDKKLHPALFQLTSSSVHRLDLAKSSSDGSDYFNDLDCNKLIDSSLGLQCEVLLIHLENRINVLDLTEKMFNLRLIIFGCKDDKDFPQQYPSTNDEFLPWLKNHLSSRCAMIRDQEYPSYIRIWINQRKQILNKNIFFAKDQHKTSDFLKSKCPCLRTIL